LWYKLQDICSRLPSFKLDQYFKMSQRWRRMMTICWESILWKWENHNLKKSVAFVLKCPMRLSSDEISIAHINFPRRMPTYKQYKKNYLLVHHKNWLHKPWCNSKKCFLEITKTKNLGNEINPKTWNENLTKPIATIFIAL
jgi:hypothetical protein